MILPLKGRGLDAPYHLQRLGLIRKKLNPEQAHRKAKKKVFLRGMASSSSWVSPATKSKELKDSLIFLYSVSSWREDDAPETGDNARASKENILCPATRLIQPKRTRQIKNADIAFHILIPR
jgi:hypothetical protein